MEKTLFGLDHILFLSSEIISHFQLDSYDSIISNTNFFISKYFDALTSCAPTANILMFVVPDKSVVCSHYIPHQYIYHNCVRIVDHITNINVYDLYKLCQLDESCYFKTDSHANFYASLIFTKTIAKILNIPLHLIDLIDHHLTSTINDVFLGDLTSKLNTTKITNFDDYKEKITYFVPKYKIIDLLKTIPLKFRFSKSRTSIYNLNNDAISNKIILIIGGSHAVPITPLLSFYFKKIFFYWNHWYIPDELITLIKPDFIIDLRTERFLFNTPSDILMTNYKIKNEKKPENQIMELISLHEYPNLKNIVKSYDEILNNYSIISDFIYHSEKFIINDELKNFINNLLTNKFNYNSDSADYNSDSDYNSADSDFISNLSILDFIDVLNAIVCCYNTKKNFNLNNIKINCFKCDKYAELNDDLKDMTDVKLFKHYINNSYEENRKYKYENIPIDFNSKCYIELNEDLKDMTDLEAKKHYEYCGYKENRKYKYENIPINFDSKSYVKLNEDLKNMTELEAKNRKYVNN